MIEVKSDNLQSIKKIFGHTDDIFILSYLQGYTGRGWVDDLENPACARIISAGFCFFAGDHGSSDAVNLVKEIPDEYKYLIIVPQNENWGNIIEQSYPNTLRRTLRYALKKDKNCFDRVKLQSFINNLSPEYNIIQNNELDFSILHGDESVCRAFPYIRCKEGIEIQINTKEAYRRKGLAMACASKLIMECLNRGLYPSWDAATEGSLALAEKLGYRFDCKYVIYEINRAKD